MNIKPAVQKASLVLLGLFLGLAILESVLRISAFVVYTSGAKAPDPLKQKNDCRILCLGESTTRKQYPLYLEEYLTRLSPGRKFTVIDKGIVGTNTTVILTWVASQLDAYRPDIVVAMMGINDSSPDKSSGIMPFITSLRSYKLFHLLALNLAARSHRSGNAGQDALPAGKTDSEYVGLGWSYRRNERFSLARRAFQKAIVLNPKNDRAYAGLGWICRIQGEYAAAEDALNKALALNPQNSVAHLNLGWLYYEQNQLLPAKAHLVLSLSSEPNDDLALTTLGDIYHELGRIPEAEAAYNNAIRVNPGNNEPRFKLAWLYAAERKPGHANAVFKAAIENSPADSRLYLELGRSYWQQGKLGLAEAVFKKAIAYHPNNDRIYAALGVLYEQSGRHVLASGYLLQAEMIRLGSLNPSTAVNYIRLKQILDRRGIKLVCVQYPMRNPRFLKNMFSGNDHGITFVDNQALFLKAVRQDGYFTYFNDVFGGDFGHCTEKGNRLLAENIAKAILGGK